MDNRYFLAAAPGWLAAAGGFLVLWRNGKRHTGDLERARGQRPGIS